MQLSTTQHALIPRGHQGEWRRRAGGEAGLGAEVLFCGPVFVRSDHIKTIVPKALCLGRGPLVNQNQPHKSDLSTSRGRRKPKGGGALLVLGATSNRGFLTLPQRNETHKLVTRERERESERMEKEEEEEAAKSKSYPRHSFPVPSLSPYACKVRTTDSLESTGMFKKLVMHAVFRKPSCGVYLRSLVLRAVRSDCRPP